MKKEFLAYLAGPRPHNPVGFIFYSQKTAGTTASIPLVWPNGERADDAEIHRRCLEHGLHCLVLVCSPKSPGTKDSCARAASDLWGTVAAKSQDGRVSFASFVRNLLEERGQRFTTSGIVVSRLDVSAASSPPKIVRSRVKEKR